MRTPDTVGDEISIILDQSSNTRRNTRHVQPCGQRDDIKLQSTNSDQIHLVTPGGRHIKISRITSKIKLQTMPEEQPENSA